MENHGAPRVVLVDVVVALPQPPLRVGDARGVLPPLALDETRPLHPRSVRLELIHPRVGLGCVSRANQQAPSDLVLPFRVVVPLRAPAASRPRPAPGHRPRPAPSSCGRPCPVRCASSSDPAWGAREYDSAPPTAGSNWKCRSPSRWRLASSDGRGGGTSATDRVGVRMDAGIRTRRSAPSPRRRRRRRPAHPPPRRRDRGAEFAAAAAYESSSPVARGAADVAVAVTAAVVVVVVVFVIVVPWRSDGDQRGRVA